MRCKNCHYALWNIKGRVCPECGDVFAPSDFEFLPNAVRFCCPVCDKAYYGTDPKGHLEPIEFTCVGCQTPIRMDEAVIRPAGADAEAPVSSSISSMPWMEREQRGVFKAWFGTVVAAMSRPRKLMRAIPERTSMTSAWVFMFLTAAIIMVCGNVVPTLISIVAITIAGKYYGPLASIAGMVTDMSLIGWGLTLVAIASLPPLWAVLTHWLLRVTGGVGADLQRTWQAIMFSAAAGGIALIPCGIEEAGMVWWIVAAILMVQAAHGCHGARASFAVLFSGAVVVVPMFALMIATMIGSAGLGMPGLANVQSVQRVTDAIIQNAGGQDARGPHHISQLIADDLLLGGDLLDVDSSTTAEDVPIGAIDLAAFQNLAANTRSAAANAAGDAVLAEAVAYRFGDFIFTYPGIPIPGDGQLWIVVQMPDPAINGAPGPKQRLYIGRDDGSTITIRTERLLLLLIDQNQKRRKAGLAPLPDLTTVLHVAPDRAEQD